MQLLPQFALLNGHEGILLEWNRSVASDFSHYEIYQSYTAGGGYQSIATTKDPYYIIPAVEPGRRYYFIIYAWDKNGNRSTPSDEIEIVIV